MLTFHINDMHVCMHLRWFSQHRGSSDTGKRGRGKEGAVGGNNKPKKADKQRKLRTGGQTERV